MTNFPNNSLSLGRGQGERGYNTHTLSNGLRIIHLPTDSEVVYCGYAINAGSRDEKPEEEGIAHFCEHMSFKGTAKLKPLQIINKLELVGGDLNAFTTKEDTFYYAAVLRQHFHRAVELLTDIVFHSEYPQHEIDKEVEVVCDEIESYRDSPAELIYDDFESEIFHGHPLGHNILGESSRVRTFTTDDCRHFTGRLYRPDNAVFYAAGNIDFAKLVKRLESALSDIDIATEKNERKLGFCFTMPNESSKIIESETHQAHVMTGSVICESIDDYRIPLYLINNIMGGPAMNSRLNLSLRERRGLVYTVESAMMTYSDALLWTIYFGCDGHDVRRCQRLVEAELRRLTDSALSVTALERAKRQLKGQLALASENRENYAIDMAKQYLHRGTLKNTERLCSSIDAVKPEEIHAMMQRFFTKDKMFTLIFNPS